MEYHILNSSGTKLASFVNEYDRDVCLDAFEETFDDCEFIVENDEPK